MRISAVRHSRASRKSPIDVAMDPEKSLGLVVYHSKSFESVRELGSVSRLTASAFALRARRVTVFSVSGACKLLDKPRWVGCRRAELVRSTSRHALVKNLCSVDTSYCS